MSRRTPLPALLALALTAPPAGAQEPVHRVSVGDARVTESDGEHAVVRVPVTLDAPAPHAVRVQFTTRDGSAVAPHDYLARFGSVAFAPGETQAAVDLAVVSDDGAEPEEVFALTLERAEGAVVGRAAGTVTVVDDDAPAGDVTPPNVRVSELGRAGRRISAHVSCPGNELRCVGRLTLYTQRDRRSPVRALRRERRVGRRSFDLAGRRGAVVRVLVPRTLYAAARRARRVRVRAFVVTRDASGNVDTTTAAATLRFTR